MSRLIKSDAVGSSKVRRVAGKPPQIHLVKPVVAHAEVDLQVQLRQEIDRLNTEIQSLKLAQATAQAAITQAEQSAYQRGRTEGVLQGLDQQIADDELKLTALKAGISSASQSFASGLADLQKLALTMTVTAVEKILGQTQDRREIVTQVIDQQINQISRQSVVSVRVAETDFPEATQLTQLQAMLTESARVIADPHLATGDCVIVLTLGEIEAGIDTQLNLLRAALQAHHD
jgi:type III secretion protein L